MLQIFFRLNFPKILSAFFVQCLDHLSILSTNSKSKTKSKHRWKVKPSTLMVLRLQLSWVNSPRANNLPCWGIFFYIVIVNFWSLVNLKKFLNVEGYLVWGNLLMRTINTVPSTWKVWISREFWGPSTQRVSVFSKVILTKAFLFFSESKTQVKIWLKKKNLSTKKNWIEKKRGGIFMLHIEVVVFVNLHVDARI